MWLGLHKEDKILKGNPPKYDQKLYKQFWWSIWRFFDRIRYKIKFLFKKIFNKYHLSGAEIWEPAFTMAPKILRYLYAYRDSERMGYPSIFSEYEDGRWPNKEDYLKEIKSGTIIGGGQERWEEYLNHIIMSFEYLAWETNDKKRKEWFLKYFGFDPYEEIDINRHISYHYRELKEKEHIASAMSSELPDLEKCEWAFKSVSYHNLDLIRYAEELVQQGFELFGKFYWNLWD